MMQSGGAEGKISKIELVGLTPGDVKKATTPMDGPTGKVCLNLKPTKKLVIKVENKDANGSSSSSSENFVAEKDGKLVIPVPGPCKYPCTIGEREHSARSGWHFASQPAEQLMISRAKVYSSCRTRTGHPATYRTMRATCSRSR